MCPLIILGPMVKQKGLSGPLKKQCEQLIFLPSLTRFLLQYRVTPHATTGVSPAESLQHRKLGTLMDLLHPDITKNVQAAQQQQKSNFDHRIKMRVFHPDEPGWVQSFSKREDKWSKGVIVKPLGPVSYLVKIGDHQHRRHLDHIRPASQFFLSQEAPVPPQSSSPLVPASASSPVPRSPSAKQSTSSSSPSF